jgi:two-component system, OmpR family, sensor histidine kinase KdpD
VKNFLIHKPSKNQQYAISVMLVILVAAGGLALYDFVGYRVVAFMLLVTVSIVAMFFDIVPVLLAASLSALLWDFFFIPPRFTFTVGTGEDQLLLLMYFLIALINATLTYKIRQMEKEVRIKEEKANEARFYNTLFNSLSHELRTPITAIIAATDNLNSRSDRIPDAVKTELLSEISIASFRLNQQVENLLSMSRLESGTFQIKKDWCDMHELIHKTLQRLEPSISKYKLALHIPENLPLFKLDFGLMEQVLHNLIGNAVQHTPEGTGIVVQAFHNENKLVMTVADNGKGFPEKEVERVFDKFYRLHGSKPGGTGLGLSIARGFVEAHHGTITLKNLPLGGAIFTIEIPTETSYINRLKNE